MRSSDRQMRTLCDLPPINDNVLAWRLAAARWSFKRWNSLRAGQLPTLVIDQDDKRMSFVD